MLKGKLIFILPSNYIVFIFYASAYRTNDSSSFVTTLLIEVWRYKLDNKFVVEGY